ncbi:type II toxin-antitoxin system RelE/ParE family toxin [Companilactobacillus halodurans]|uniref:Plasmid maintenance system killer protein n=1 Tax=Companilactobacillus halodurans TaxID=2584183 RepID=A0A5P0ZXI2_9LACO|nr:plasmid maintenance system killer protein [Companilactobacillus halodurans]MQS76206.1 plasmid maintenance system killer protein [Companilactobacillus halodurans]MQS97434.1 plasmid maintenance system killer protein [Companilactobacillus halodurans]
MRITFKNNKIERECLHNDIAIRKFGLDMAIKIEQRISEIWSFETVEQLVQLSIGRCHPLHGSRKGQYAMDLIQPYRLIFVKSKLGLQVVQIIEITDYH